MPFNAIILEERDKAIHLCHLPDNISSLGSCYSVFWLPITTIYRMEEQNKKTKTGKTVHRIYYHTWSSNLVQNNYDSGKYKSLPKISDIRKTIIKTLAVEGDLNRDELKIITTIPRTTLKNNLDVLISALLVYEYKKPRETIGTPKVYYGITDRGLDVAEDLLFKGKPSYKMRSNIKKKRQKIKKRVE